MDINRLVLASTLAHILLLGACGSSEDSTDAGSGLSNMNLPSIRLPAEGTFELGVQAGRLTYWVSLSTTNPDLLRFYEDRTSDAERVMGDVLRDRTCDELKDGRLIEQREIDLNLALTKFHDQTNGLVVRPIEKFHAVRLRVVACES